VLFCPCSTVSRNCTTTVMETCCYVRPVVLNLLYHTPALRSLY
jgi:hypothetical protein